MVQLRVLSLMGAVLGAAAMGALGIGVSAQTPQLPLQPARDNGQSITGAFEGWFKNADGSSAVVANLRTLCDPTETLCQVLKVPNFLDTDTTALGGHGTHVNGIVAGRPTTLTSGEKLQGAAPGASLVSISAGAALLVLGADASLNWVLENHKAPCGAGVPAAGRRASRPGRDGCRPAARRWRARHAGRGS